MTGRKFTVIFFDDGLDIEQTDTAVALVDLYCFINIVLFFDFAGKRVGDVVKR